MASNQQQPLSSTLLPLHADAAAFLQRRGLCSSSPSPSPAPLLLAVATYELIPDTNERRGGIHLFDASGGELTPLGGVGSGRSNGGEESAAAADPPPPPFPGVFDLRWMSLEEENDSPPSLGVALADGSVRLMEVVKGGDGEGALLLRETARRSPLEVEREKEEQEEEQEEEEAAAASLPSMPSHPLDDPAAMALYLDVDKNTPRRIAVSFSDGRVAVLEATSTATMAAATEADPEAKKEKNLLETRALWRAHDAECWCVSLSPLDQNTVYTGADDCEFLAWDLREIGGGSGGAKRKPKPAWRAGAAGAAGKHSAGVCCISPSPPSASGNNSLIATGSYDGQVRLWDARSPREPLFVCASAKEGEGERETPSSSSSAPLGGGAWRLVWHPGGQPRLLCAAMHAGFAVLRLKRGEGEEATILEVEQRYRAHGADPSLRNGGAATLGYGCDWTFDDESGGLVAATASFYDNALHLWEPR